MPTIFVSHASEDKQAFVRPLVHALKKHGLQVWYDEFSLRPGDSLRRAIDRGLKECSAGIVVLSPSFFAKEWPQRELDALFSIEMAGLAKLIPVWHQVNQSDVSRVSPLLADRFALLAQEGVDVIAAKIAEQFPPSEKISGSELAGLIERHQHPGFYEGEALYIGCKDRFLRMNAFKEEYGVIIDSAMDRFDDDIDDFPLEFQKQFEAEEKRLREKYNIPEDVYLTTDEPVRDENLSWWMDSICKWTAGTLDRAASAELVFELDLEQLDEYYVLLGIPNFSISGKQRELLERALVEMGCGLEDDFAQLIPICNALRD